jgi:esterase
MKLFFRRMGQGFPVIVLHGLLGLSDNWITFGRQLAGSFDVIIPDFRNHGQSTHDDVFEIPVLADDIEELIYDLKLNKVHLIGHSLGGRVAMYLATKSPSLLEKLVVVDISLRNYASYDEHRSLMETMQRVDFASAHTRSDVDRMLATEIGSQRLRQFLLKSIYWKDRNTLAWRVNLDVLLQSLPNLMNHEEMKGEFGGKTLVVRGGKSGYVTDDDLIGMKRKFPRMSVVTFENASHWVHADVPEEFYFQVSSFLLS